MQIILILTDTPARGHRLARDLGTLGPALVVDLLDPDHIDVEPSPASVRLVVSDISFGRSQPIARLRRHLERLGARRPRLVCVLHEDSPRAHAQALALGATSTLRAHQAADRLKRLLSAVTADGHVSEAGIDVARNVANADAALTRIFDLGRAGHRIEPNIISVGVELVEGALRQADVRAWLDIVWQFDDATHQHCLLVAGLAAGFAQHLGLHYSDCQKVTEAALLHDVGKSRIPLSVLNKPARLNAAELAIMRSHPLLGYDMLQEQDFPDAMLAVVRSHHEALDGSGYPDGLVGTRIPDIVRLITVCDVFGALIERRPYKRPVGGDQAFAILQNMGGTVDQDLVRAFQPLAEAAGSSISQACA